MALDPLELQLQVVVSPPVWVRTEHRSSTKAAHTLHPRDNRPAPQAMNLTPKGSAEDPPHIKHRKASCQR